MKYILCYGDSNTWGCIPNTVLRYEFNERWPGILQKELGENFRIYENALNGRTTVFEDFIEEGRSGKVGLPVLLEAHAPLDLILVMLGTNDCKKRFSMEPWDIAWGMDLLIKYMKKNEYGRNGIPPQILLISPPHMGNEWENTMLGTVFGEDSARKAMELSKIYPLIASKNQVEFFDSAPFCQVGADCIHLLPGAHKNLAAALAPKVRELLSNL